MRIADFLTEQIGSFPRHLGTYLNRPIRVLDQIIPQVQQAVATIKDDSGEGDYLLRYALGVANGGDRPLLPNDYSLDLDRHYHLNDLRQSLDSIRQFGPNQFLQYAITTLGWIKPLSDDTRHVLSLMPHVEAGFQEYGYERDSQDEEYLAARKLAAAYDTIRRLLGQAEAVIAEVKAVLLDRVKRNQFARDPHLYRPDHGEVEPLYHATLYASQIVRDGFAAERPAERKGLGNLGHQPEISFTHNLKVAHDIMRALRDCWMIVHGQITRNTILAWMRAEGMDPNKASMFLSSREPLDSVPQVIRFYRAYLGLTKLRTDPGFISPEELIPQLQRIGLKDIGIVRCDVRLDGKEEYLHGESEFRVTADRVVGPIQRII